MFAGRQEGESIFDVSLKYWKLSTTIENDSAHQMFPCYFNLKKKSDLFSEKLQNLGTKLELVTFRYFKPS